MVSAEWREWLKRARELVVVSLATCIVGPSGDVLATQLHVFADASEAAYSAVAYLRREVGAPGGGTERFDFTDGKVVGKPDQVCVRAAPRVVCCRVGGKVRKALVRAGASLYVRPIHKMVLIRSESDLE